MLFFFSCALWSWWKMNAFIFCIAKKKKISGRLYIFIKPGSIYVHAFMSNWVQRKGFIYMKKKTNLNMEPQNVQILFSNRRKFIFVKTNNRSVQGYYWPCSLQKEPFCSYSEVLILF